MNYRFFLMSGVIWLITVGFAGAQGMMDYQLPVDDHTAAEEAAGRLIWLKLQNRETTCGQLAEDDLGELGEYFMGQMMGASHGSMNRMITQMHGEEGEEAMHVTLGKRLSGCDPEAVFAPGAFGLMPMMNMGFGMWGSRGGGMMGSGPGSWGNFGSGWNSGLGGAVFMILWWIVLIAGIVTIVKWLASFFKGKNKSDGSLE